MEIDLVVIKEVGESPKYKRFVVKEVGGTDKFFCSILKDEAAGIGRGSRFKAILKFMATYGEGSQYQNVVAKVIPRINTKNVKLKVFEILGQSVKNVWLLTGVVGQDHSLKVHMPIAEAEGLKVGNVFKAQLTFGVIEKKIKSDTLIHEQLIQAKRVLNSKQQKERQEKTKGTVESFQG